MTNLPDNVQVCDIPGWSDNDVAVERAIEDKEREVDEYPLEFIYECIEQFAIDRIADLLWNEFGEEIKENIRGEI